MRKYLFILLLCLILIPSLVFAESSRRLPTAYITQSYGGAGGTDCGGGGCDYTALATWEAACDEDLTALTTLTEETSFGWVTVYLADATPFSDGSGWEAGDTLTINPGEANEETVVVESRSTNTITLVSAVTKDHDFGEPVAAGVVLECYDDAASFDDYFAAAGGTTSTAYYRVLQAATGEGNDGTPDTGVHFSHNSGATARHMFTLSEDYFTIQDLIITLTCDTGDFVKGAVYVDATNYVHMAGCIIFNSDNAGAGNAQGVIVEAGQLRAVNSMSLDNKGMGWRMVGAGAANLTVLSCQAIGQSSVGFGNAGAGCTLIARNCLADDNQAGNDFWSSAGVMSVTYCASGDASANDWSATGTRINQTFAYQTGANNYKIATTDTGAKGYGWDLSANGPWNFTDDVLKETIFTWDIGFYTPTVGVNVDTLYLTAEPFGVTVSSVTPVDIWYVDSEVVGGNDDGTSWANAFATVQEGITAASDAGEVVEISGGASGLTYDETLTATAQDYIIIKGSTETGYDGTVTLTSTGNSADCLATDKTITVENLTFSQADSTFYLLDASGAGKTVYINDSTFSNTTFHSVRITGDSSGTFNRCKFSSETQCVDIDNDSAFTTQFNYCLFQDCGTGIEINYGTKHIFNNCVLVGTNTNAIRAEEDFAGEVEINNTIFSSNAANTTPYHVVDNQSTAGGTVTLYNSVPLPHPFKATAKYGSYGFSSCTNGGGNVYKGIKLYSPRYRGWLSINIDDSTNLGDFETLAGEAKTRGFDITFGVHAGWASIDAQFWSDCEDLVDDGHEISAHGYKHGKVGVLKAFTIRYTGGSACTASNTLSTGPFTTQLDGAGTDLSYDTTHADYDQLQELIDAIDGNADYTATITVAGVNQNPAVLCSGIDDLTTQDIKTADYEVLLDETQFHADEITQSQTVIEANVSGWTVQSYLYPHGSYSANAITAIAADGYIGARATDINTDEAKDIWQNSIYKTYGGYVGDMLTTSDDTTGAFTTMNLDARITSLIENVGYYYQHIVLFGHSFEDWSLANWKLIFDAIANVDVSLETTGNVYQWILDNDDHVTSNVSYACSDESIDCIEDNMNLHPASGSALLDAGRNVSLRFDYEGTALDTITPNIGLYETSLVRVLIDESFEGDEYEENWTEVGL